VIKEEFDRRHITEGALYVTADNEGEYKECLWALSNVIYSLYRT